MAHAVRSQYRHFTVDEYQDISPLQFRLLRAWLGNASDVCVVGDAAQTIYSYAGADSSYLLEFRKEFPRANVIRLERNYRSSPQIVQVANAVLARAQEGRDSHVELRAQRSDATRPLVVGYPDETVEGVRLRARLPSFSRRAGMRARLPFSCASMLTASGSRMLSTARGSRTRCAAARSSSSGARCTRR